MKAKDVQPKDWNWDENYPIRVLFDDGEYSVIWGKYRDIPTLGTRWNENSENDRGFPGQGGNPTWYVEPDFIATAILQRLLTLSLDTQNHGNLDDILFAIKELNDKLSQFDEP